MVPEKGALEMDLLFEIGTEEMPASAIAEAMEELTSHFGSLLEGSGLRSYDELRVLGGPRRIALLCLGLPSQSAERVIKKKGPPLAKSKDEKGNWTAAAIGFASSYGMEPADLLIEETNKGEYLFAVRRVEGVPARDILAGILEKTASSIHFNRSMRWGYSEVQFSRPVRWLVALADKDVLSVKIAGVSAGNISRGHRYLSGGPVGIDVPRN
ncbi:MAG: glycine--tRNA ligase subunit beta, partial [Actinomycetota bacterium]|nr:glycine--tRNA ligase subunit beta [Actinomycetota bacterium]